MFVSQLDDEMIKTNDSLVVWVGYPATGEMLRMVISTSRKKVLEEIGSTERRFEFGKVSGEDRAEVRGKDGVWVVFKTGVLRVRRPRVGKNRTNNLKGRRDDYAE
jgi:hypothetical protein